MNISSKGPMKAFRRTRLYYLKAYSIQKPCLTAIETTTSFYCYHLNVLPIILDIALLLGCINGNNISALSIVLHCHGK